MDSFCLFDVKCNNIGGFRLLCIMDPTVPTRRVPRRRREEEVHPLRSNGSNNGHHPTNNHYGHDRYTTAQLYQQHSHGNSVRQQSLRRRGSSLLKDEASYITSSCNDNGPSEIYAASRIQSNTRRTVHSRLARIIILCAVVFYGFQIGWGIVRNAVRLVFGHRKEHQQQDFDTIDNLRFTLRGSSDKDIADGGMSLHDLNAQSHLLKAEGESLQLVHEEDPIEDTTEEDKVSEGYEVYMGEDSTTDYFFAGNIKSTKNEVDKSGRLKAVTIPAQKYATLPFSVESNPFALSMWVYLSPRSEMMDEDSTLEDSRTTRVILSTLSGENQEDSSVGCMSDIFGPAKGIVLYAQPDYGDSSVENEAQYRILLQYASAGSKSCHNIGLNRDAVLASEGQWVHVSIFVTRVDNSQIEDDEGDERISLYVGGDLAGRGYVTGRLRSNTSDTLIGRTRDARDVAGSKQKSIEYRGLGGRVGMLSFWEIGGPESLVSSAERMQIKSMDDEDHVTRAINRAAFDLRAIQELSLQGLIVKEPNLLYTFDGEDDKIGDGQLHDLHDLPTSMDIKEVIMGKDGTVRIADMNGDPVLVHEYVPLGGFRYPEYRDGNYQPPKWRDTEREELDQLALARSVIVKKAMEHAWSGYERWCWGKDELQPLSNSCNDNFGGMGATLIDSLSTLWLFGMKEEFYKARDWVRDSLNFYDVEGGVSVFETTIRVLGGLLSAYDLSGEPVFKWAADDLGQRLMKAFKTKSIIPYGEVELDNEGAAYNTAWHSNSAVLAELGTLQVEFRYLAKISGRIEYATEAMRALDELLKIDTHDGLYPTLIHNLQLKPSFANDEISIGSFYEYLLKIWLQGGKAEIKYRRAYDRAMKGIMDKLVHISRPSYLTYVAELKNGKIVHKMDHLTCFLGGNLALGAFTHPDGIKSSEAQRQLKTGKQLAYTCYQMYARSDSGLSPEYVDFRNGKHDFEKGRNAPYYLLRPEVSETMFIPYHLTKDPVYREWGWEIFQAIEEQTKTDSAYAAIKDVDTMEKDDRMESFFMAETLKYLYLLQNDNHTIDLLNTVSTTRSLFPLTFLNQFTSIFVSLGILLHTLVADRTLSKLYTARIQH